MKNESVRVLRKLSDVASIKDKLGPGTVVAIVGGGFLGLEVAASAVGAGSNVHVIEREPRLLSRVLPPNISEQMLALHRRAGVNIHLGQNVESIEMGSAGNAIHLDGGTSLEVHLIVASIGMNPNTQLAEAAGIPCNRGVLTDALCRTADRHILRRRRCGEFVSQSVWEPPKAGILAQC